MLRRVQWATHLGLVAMLVSSGGCGREARQAVEPVAVSRDGDAPTDGRQRAARDDDAPASDDTAMDSSGHSAAQDAPTGGALAKGAGLWVVDAAGTVVGWLAQRGHPFQTQDGRVDMLRDGVLVYSVSAAVFFGVEMQSGKILVPRLGIADPQCTTPTVAGYYTEGDERSGMGYAFVYGDKWWRVRAGQPTEVVQCAGVTKQGATPSCVLHSGTCRGFPVEILPSAKLPLRFKPPLHITFGLAP